MILVHAIVQQIRDDGHGIAEVNIEVYVVAEHNVSAVGIQ